MTTPASRHAGPHATNGIRDTATRAALLTRPQAAEALSVGLRTLDSLIASGDLPVVRIGAAVRIRPSSLEFLIEANSTRSNPKRRGSRK